MSKSAINKSHPALVELFGSRNIGDDAKVRRAVQSMVDRGIITIKNVADFGNYSPAVFLNEHRFGVQMLGILTSELDKRGVKLRGARKNPAVNRGSRLDPFEVIEESPNAANVTLGRIDASVLHLRRDRDESRAAIVALLREVKALTERLKSLEVDMEALKHDRRGQTQRIGLVDVEEAEKAREADGESDVWRSVLEDLGVKNERD